MEAKHHPLQRLVTKLSDRSALSEDDREAVLALPYSTRAKSAGQHLARVGQVPTSCTLLLSGFAQRYRLLADGARQIVGFHVEGDFVDLHFSMLHRASQCVQLLTPARVADIPKAAMVELMRSRPAVAEAIWIESLADASIVQEWVVSIGRRSARSRLAHLFCELGLRQEQAGLGSRCRIELPLTQEQLGDALGLTTVHINRTVKLLENERLIERSRRSVIIPDWEKLAEVGGFSSAYLHFAASEPTLSQVNCP
ncbi:Crp/Fnr family transcriptional regulator [Sphingobium bisphenolivorans]|uniref:Crp/Fnr family transcriptional regulator n=1 Tax=Sphingobium bisphenolivorans TaxID=1335760 RepID=UPI0003AAA2D3|nr:Crp/Fnr family transcriptional regulator [Sphingobium bisphenolivorans]